MQAFRYQHGDRPLEGYTIQRGVGRGGFGEVYYALSDSGREVALKAVQGYEAIELRGVGNCMNLKSPHLITVFDLKHNDAGQPFVIMEYVPGPSLRQLLDESACGLGAQKAAYFLREIGKGLTYLHDRGIVHRDLKPGNIFYDEGYVKIGDYGLSKAISTSQHSAQTVTVGTVQYMAPEIGKGHYDRGIDIYSLGAMLYEMLTGRTPFEGDSAGEILMKHLATEPDLTGVDEPFLSVIRKALAKDPAHRYGSVQEMVEALYGEEHIRQSVSHFAPESLSMVADRAAKHVGAAGTHTPPPPPPVAPVDGSGRTPRNRWDERVDRWHARKAQRRERLAQKRDRISQRLRDRFDWPRSERVAEALGEPPQGLALTAADDPLTRSHRRMLFLMTAVIMAVGTGVAGADPRHDAGLTGLFAFCMMVGASLGVLIARRRFGDRLDGESGLVQRLVYGGCASVVPLLWLLLSTMAMDRRMGVRVLPGGHDVAPPFMSPSFGTPYRSEVGAVILAVILGLFALNWTARTRLGRSERVSLGWAVWAGIVGAVAAAVTDVGSPALPVGILAGVSLVAQLGSPFVPRRYRVSRTRSAGTPPTPKPPTRDKRTPPDAGFAGSAAPPAGAAGRVSPTPPGQGSHRRRLWAMLLALAGGLGVCGLHRFYVGKIGTGVLWLCTGGLLGLGQLLDIILIASGRFRDVDGRFLIEWTGPEGGDDTPAQPHTYAAPSAPASRPSSIAATAAEVTNAGLNFVAMLLVLSSVSVGLAWAVDVPAMAAAGVPDAGLAEELQRDFGYAEWPRLVERILISITVIQMMLASVLMIITRRPGGASHMFRAPLGNAGLILSFATLNSAFARVPWDDIAALMQADKNTAALDMVLTRAEDGMLVFAMAIFLVSTLILAWPAKRQQSDLPPNRGEGV